jgi:hypothetical protein
MRHRGRLARFARGVAVAALLVGCTEGTLPPETVSRVATLAITPPPQTLTVGKTAQLVAVGRDAAGQIIPDLAAEWTTDAPLVASVSETGLVTALTPGSTVVSARVEERSAAITVTVRAVSIASVTIAPGVLALNVGTTRQVSAVARDADGNELSDRAVAWTTSNSSVVTISPDGLASARAAGFATLTAESEGKSQRADVTVCATTGLYLTGVVPAALSPGKPATIAGCNFAASLAGNIVTIDGAPASVLSAAPNELQVMLPPAAYSCVPERATTISLTAGGATATRQHRLATAARRALAVGESVLLLDASGARCNELPTGGGKYFISVFNTSGVASVQTTVQLRGVSSAAAGGQILVPAEPPSLDRRSTSARAILASREGIPLVDEVLHGTLLDESGAIARRLGNPSRYRGPPAEPRQPGAGSLSAALVPSLAVGAVGDVVPMRVWRRSDGSCDQYDEIRARTVYIGTRSIIREDVAAPLAGTMDDHLRAVGREFDESMFPLLTQNFGDPLALDASLDDNQRIVMVFTKRVNDDNLAGFVVSCDFYPRSAAPSSNVGEIFYAFVPTDPSAGYPSGLLTKDKWRRQIRSTLIHEAKHITSFAEHLSRNADFEESWLEEGTAMHAEELWSRGTYGSVWKGNTTYRSSIYCDARQTTAECADRPYVMMNHFSLLYDYLASVETLTPLGRATATDYSFYGSAWAFVRWVIDQHAASDAAFLKPLTQEGTLTGLANISARVDRPFGELLGDWSLAMAVDDYPNLTVLRQQLTFPSWQTRDIFLALNRDFPGFPRSVPLATRLVPYGTFAIDVTVRGGTAAIFELSGVQTSTQLLELRTSTGGPPPDNMRIAIVRVQ